MTILIDTDILLDAALDRAPHADAAVALLNLLHAKPGMGYVAWHTLSNFYYLTRPQRGHKDSKLFIGELLQFVAVTPTGTKDALYALDLPFSDFEDALQSASAIACRARWIVTRNTRHYLKSPVPAITPARFLQLKVVDDG